MTTASPDAFRRTRRPLALAAPPDRFSHTALESLRECPRRWQLVRSTWPWGGRYPERSGPAVIRGRIVHRALDEVVSRLRAAGSPPWGSAPFQSVTRGFLGESRLRTIAAEETALVAQNPRHALIGVPEVRHEDCRNALVRLLKLTWSNAPSGPRPSKSESTGPRVGTRECRLPPLRHGDLLPEVPLEHPRLPLEGRVDLIEIRDDGDVIIDVKTGGFREAYVGQVRLYSLLWWRTTGRLPRAARVVSLDDQPEDVLINDTDLLALEATLTAEIATWRSRGSGGMPPRPDPDTCRWCPVRQLCDDYWTAECVASRRWAAATDADGLRDLSARVVEWRSLASLSARTADGVEITVQASHGVVFDPVECAVGVDLRALGVARTDPTTFLVLGTSEVFSFPPAT